MLQIELAFLGENCYPKTQFPCIYFYTCHSAFQSLKVFPKFCWLEAKVCFTRPSISWPSIPITFSCVRLSKKKTLKRHVIVRHCSPLDSPMPVILYRDVKHVKEEHMREEVLLDCFWWIFQLARRWQLHTFATVGWEREHK